MNKVLLGLIILILTSCSSKDANLLTDHNPPKGFKKIAGDVYLQSETPEVLKNYTAFHINPIIIYSNDKGRLVVPTQIEVDRLAKLFRDKLIRELGSSYTGFDHPAPHVAIIDIKIVDLWTSRAIEALRPGLIFPNNLSGGATIEATFFDSKSREIIATVWDSRPGDRTGFFSGLTKWKSTEAAFDEWTQLLKKSIKPSHY